jgi:hypothetical protein
MSKQPHLKNIYQEGELDPKATSEEFSVVRTEADFAKAEREVKRIQSRGRSEEVNDE